MSLLDKANNLMIPSGYKAGYIYTVLPNTGDGDFDFDRSSEATRINTNKFIETKSFDTPRLDYIDTTCPILLTEDASTNLLTYPVSFDTSWVKQNISTLSGYTSPHVDYPNSAYKLVENTVNGAHYISSHSINFDGSSYYTASIYVKKGERNWLFLTSSLSLRWAAYAFFDLETGTIGTTVPPSGTATIEEVGNGYYKCTLTGLSGAAGTATLRVSLSDGDEFVDTGYQGDGTSGIYIFGAQFEKLDYPSSFIYDGTEGSTTTRAIEKVSGAEYVGDSESGVLYIEMAALVNNLSDRLITISDGTAANQVIIKFAGVSNRILFQVVVGGVYVYQKANDGFDITEYNKISLRWAVNDFSFWVNGIEYQPQSTGLSFAAGTLNVINLANPIVGYGYMFSKIKELATFDYLTDTEMVELTT